MCVSVIKDYPDYFVTDDGRVYSYKTNKWLTPRMVRGYAKVHLTNDKGIADIGIHRLVAEAFIPNPKGLREVDHINTNRADNNVGNLRWVTHKGNHHNPISLYLHHRCKTIIRRNPVDGECVVYKTLTEVVEDTGLNKGSIYKCLNLDKYPSKSGALYKGYEWYYYNKFPLEYHKAHFNNLDRL